MIPENSCVVVYDKHLQIEKTVRLLQEKGFDIKKLFIVGKGYQCEEERAHDVLAKGGARDITIHLS